MVGSEEDPEESISSDHTARYLRYRARHRCPKRDDVATLRRLLDLLREEGVISEQPACPESTPAQRLLDKYACYLRQERALSPRTLIYYLDFARGFLEQTFGEGKLEMSAAPCRRRDQVRSAPGCARVSRVSKKVDDGLALVSPICSRYRGYITGDLAAGVPTVANWSMPSIPRSIAATDVRRVLAHCDRRTVVGSRDYAILLLLARLGLRAGAVAFLELDDIDWEAATLSVRGKDGHVHVLPLPIEVGKAIAAYLESARSAPAEGCSRAQERPLRLQDVFRGGVGREARHGSRGDRFATQGRASVPACVGV